MKIYIAGKITGDSNYREKFEKAENWALKEGYEPINPARLNLPESCTWDECMSVTLKMLELADAIYLLLDWRESPGACTEYGYALAKDMIILKQTQEELEG